MNDLILKSAKLAIKNLRDYLKILHEQWNKEERDFELDTLLSDFTSQLSTTNWLIDRLRKDRPF